MYDHYVTLTPQACVREHPVTVEYCQRSVNKADYAADSSLDHDSSVRVD